MLTVCQVAAVCALVALYLLWPKFRVYRVLRYYGKSRWEAARAALWYGPIVGSLYLGLKSTNWNRRGATIVALFPIINIPPHQNWPREPTPEEALVRVACGESHYCAYVPLQNLETLEKLPNSKGAAYTRDADGRGALTLWTSETKRVIML